MSFAGAFPDNAAPVTSFPAVNTFSVASILMPGKWTLLDADKKFGWQIQQGYALSGAFVFPKGDELVVARFKGEFWSQVDFALFKEIRPKFLEKGVFLIGGILNASAMGIEHPELKAMGVTSVVVLKISPVIQEEGGLWVVHIDFLQYRRPLPAVPKPKQIIPDVNPALTAAKNNVEKEQADLRAQINALHKVP